MWHQRGRRPESLNGFQFCPTDGRIFQTLRPRSCKLAKGKPTSDSGGENSTLFSAEHLAAVRDMSERPDRRKSRRMKDPILILLYRDREGSKTARPLDLSLEGIGIETGSPLKIDESLHLAIIIGESQVNARGRAVYSRRAKSGRFRSGIKFEQISDRNRGIIKLYLEKTRQLRRSGEDEADP